MRHKNRPYESEQEPPSRSDYTEDREGWGCGKPRELAHTVLRELGAGKEQPRSLHSLPLALASLQGDAPLLATALPLQQRHAREEGDTGPRPPPAVQYFSPRDNEMEEISAENSDY